MAAHRTGFFHHVGTFLLLAATVLLIITDISAPVVDEIGILKVQLDSRRSADEVSFGTFGYCFINDGPTRNFCSNSMVGYSPADVMTEADGTDYSGLASDTTYGLTKVMILHPVATGLCFLAFVMSPGAGVFGSLLAALLSAVAFIVTLVVLVCDFVLFAIVKSAINNQNNDSFAYFSVGIWTVLVSAICSFLATIVVFFTCCSGRLRRRRERHSKVEPLASPPVTRRRRWWSRA